MNPVFSIPPGRRQSPTLTEAVIEVKICGGVEASWLFQKRGRVIPLWS